MNLEHIEGGRAPPPRHTTHPSKPATHVSAEAIAALRGHPALAAATTELFESITRHQAAQGIRRFIIGDKGRRLAFWAALSLHAEREFGDGAGLTVNRFCDSLHEHGDMSRGRARALFLFMRHAGFLERAGVARPGLPVPYAPAERMIRLATDRLSVGLRALARISPIGAEGIVALADPDFPPLLCMKIGAMVADGIRPLASEPALDVFLGRDGGEYIAMHLYLAFMTATPAEHADGFVFQLTATAKQTHVSRPHVSKLIRQATDAGLVVRRGREHIVLSDTFLNAISDSVALTLTLLEKMTRSALTEFNRRL